MPRKASIFCDQSSLPVASSTPASSSRVCTKNCGCPAIVAFMGDENALPFMPPPSCSDRQTVSPFRLLSFTNEAPA